MRRRNILKILKHWKNPIYLRNIFIYKIASILNKNKKGFNIFEEDWDNLIILDACRYDVFKSEFNKRKMKGKLYLKKSMGSHTTTFLQKNFIKNDYRNYIYLAGNPYVDLAIKDKTIKIISVWKNGWDDKYGTVLPETMYNYAIDALMNYPNKKLIIHFVQPHYPYIGYKIKEATMKSFREKMLLNPSFTRKRERKYKDNFFSFYARDMYAVIDRKTHFKMYSKNLELVLPYIEKLIDILPGKTVVSADHGEALGEYLHPLIPIRIYGHNKAFLIPTLVDVPWLIVDKKEKNSSKIEELKNRQKLSKVISNLKISKKI